MAAPIVKRMKLPMEKIKSRSDRVAAKEEVVDYLENVILEYVSESKTPVQGGKWKKSLSPEYKKKKIKISGSDRPNMELFGDMLDDFKVEFDGNYVKFGIYGKGSTLSKKKADNHNKFSDKARKTKVPERNFIPRENQNLKKEIMDEINSIINSYADNSEDQEFI